MMLQEVLSRGAVDGSYQQRMSSCVGASVNNEQGELRKPGRVSRFREELFQGYVYNIRDTPW